MPKPKYTMRPEAADLFERAGVNQAEFARQVKLSASALNRKLTGKQPGTLGATAWSIARLYAAQCQISEEEALQLLFERTQEAEEPAQQEATA